MTLTISEAQAAVAQARHNVGVYLDAMKKTGTLSAHQIVAYSTDLETLSRDLAELQLIIAADPAAPVAPAVAPANVPVVAWPPPYVVDPSRVVGEGSPVPAVRVIAPVAGDWVTLSSADFLKPTEAELIWSVFLAADEAEKAASGKSMANAEPLAVELAVFGKLAAAGTIPSDWQAVLEAANYLVAKADQLAESGDPSV